MTVTVDNLKISLRVDSTVDDDLLNRYILAATNYIKNAIGTDDVKFYADDNISSLVDVHTGLLVMLYHKLIAQWRLLLSKVRVLTVSGAT
ncbi:head-tail connector protein [Leuconostoc mesenteroides]|uniref:head-tail connector protein n=1 Tax=Leuconostoc mesenteroides TaxID=1245 RepID=UPI00207430EA|nr:head-tail connector protein [Leuconostoc mesenteroides]MCM6837731.1 head-tail connector protein [Leuconostoc mesenteroides]